MVVGEIRFYACSTLYKRKVLRSPWGSGPAQGETPTAPLSSYAGKKKEESEHNGSLNPLTGQWDQ